MALTKEDLQEIRGIVKEIVSETEQNLRAEMATKEDLASIKTDLVSLEANLRAEIIYNRGEINSVKTDLRELREDLENYNISRVEDEDSLNSDAVKYLARVKKLEARVAKLEKGAA